MSDGVVVAKFKSVGDWEVLYIDGDAVDQNHIGRVDVVPHLEGLTIDTVIDTRVNLPEGETHYPSDLDTVLEDERYDITEDDVQ